MTLWVFKLSSFSCLRSNLKIVNILCRNILILLFVFIEFNKLTCDVQLDLALVRSPSKRS